MIHLQCLIIDRLGVHSFGRTALNSFSVVCYLHVQTPRHHSLCTFTPNVFAVFLPSTRIFDFHTSFSHQILQVASVSDLNESDDSESHGPEGNITGKMTFSLNL